MKLDVIIPAYNCASTLGRTLDSLVGQTNIDFSVLIVDDCSTQDIISIVDMYRDKLTIQYIRNHKNLGCGMSRQRGIDETSADYITFLDADDILLPNAIDVWTTEIHRAEPDVICSQFLFASKENIVLRDNGLTMCHGKVYSVDFLRKYDIGESPDVTCVDDAYLNWQAFDLAQNISVLPDITHIQINTQGSITHTQRFLFNLIQDSCNAKRLAVEHISRFKDNPLSNFNAIKRQVEIMLKAEAEIHKKFIDTVDMKRLSTNLQNFEIDKLKGEKQ